MDPDWSKLRELSNILTFSAAASHLWPNYCTCHCAKLRRRPLLPLPRGGRRGIWRTGQALSTGPSQHWDYISGSFGPTIERSIIDPTDSNGKRSMPAPANRNLGRLEAGGGIYKTRRSGNTWQKLPTW